MLSREQSRNVKIITDEETQLYYDDVQTKSQNKIQVFEDEDTPLAVRKTQSLKKMMSVFFKSSGNMQTLTNYLKTRLKLLENLP